MDLNIVFMQIETPTFFQYNAPPRYIYISHSIIHACIRNLDPNNFGGGECQLKTKVFFCQKWNPNYFLCNPLTISNSALVQIFIPVDGACVVCNHVVTQLPLHTWQTIVFIQPGMQEMSIIIYAYHVPVEQY